LVLVAQRGLATVRKCCEIVSTGSNSNIFRALYTFHHPLEDPAVLASQMSSLPPTIIPPTPSVSTSAPLSFAAPLASTTPVTNPLNESFCHDSGTGGNHFGTNTDNHLLHQLTYLRITL